MKVVYFYLSTVNIEGRNITRIQRKSKLNQSDEAVYYIMDGKLITFEEWMDFKHNLDKHEREAVSGAFRLSKVCAEVHDNAGLSIDHSSSAVGDFTWMIVAHDEPTEIQVFTNGRVLRNNSEWNALCKVVGSVSIENPTSAILNREGWTFRLWADGQVTSNEQI